MTSNMTPYLAWMSPSYGTWATIYDARKKLWQYTVQTRAQARKQDDIEQEVKSLDAGSGVSPSPLAEYSSDIDSESEQKSDPSDSDILSDGEDDSQSDQVRFSP